MSQYSSDSDDTVVDQNNGGGNENVTLRDKPAHVSTAPSGTSRHRNNLRVPAFDPEEPEIWFALLEGQFAANEIKQDAVKFNLVINNLDIQHSKVVKDVLLKPPEEKKYKKIKSELIKRLTASQEKKVRQLLIHEELGDRKPSQFLRHLQGLAGPKVPEEFLRTIWCNRLPESIQTVLASQPGHSLEQLSDLADRIQEITTPCNVSALATTSLHGTSASSEITELKRMVERLTLKLEEHTRSAQCSSIRSRPQRQSSGSRSRQRSRSNSSYRKYPLCWYHAKFGDRAHSCIKPCDYKKAENSMGSR